MARPALSQTKLLEIALRCAEVLAQTGTGATTAQLVAASGMSERTFFRYFPTKAECVRPVLEHGLNEFVANVAGIVPTPGTHQSLRALIQSAFVRAYQTEALAHGTQFLATLLDASAYRRLWLEINDNTITKLEAPLAKLLGEAPNSLTVTVAAQEATMLAVATITHMVRTGETIERAAAQVGEILSNSPLNRIVAV
ncbi:TetR family transcriptional regulator [Jonesiaceae bacterium BS-20]|uniref:TetR family transcriptional regulator n=1 Tax=Jonesiaceae bacterium BS-20 TaxID=3120821 RepID=A0AAU7DQJ4_9MICO